RDAADDVLDDQQAAVANARRPDKNAVPPSPRILRLYGRHGGESERRDARDKPYALHHRMPQRPKERGASGNAWTTSSKLRTSAASVLRSIRHPPHIDGLDRAGAARDEY